jgi:hypothetical protein
MHPVGNILFGKPMIIDTSSFNFQLSSDSVSTTSVIQGSATANITRDGVQYQVYWDGTKWRFSANNSIVPFVV